MSGIAGLLHRDGTPAHADEVAGALSALARRGPDRQEIWCRGPIAMACAQLCTTPQSRHEVLPFEDHERGLTIVHDARLDNRDELWRALLPEARRLAEISDGELLLAAWRRWGETCPEHLLGDFAFAIWDESSRELFLARDHVGMRMLFLHQSERLLVFASEIKGVAAVPGVPRRLDPARVADYMLGVACDPVITFRAGIGRLLPAQTLLAGRTACRTRRYYAITLPDQMHPGGPDEVAAGFRSVLATAVGARLSASGPVGSMLSGGLDSSAIVSLARWLRRDEPGALLPTFSLVFPKTPGADETIFIRSLVAQGGLEPHFIDADAITPLSHLDDILAAVDEPFYGAPFPCQWATYQAAHGHGVNVLLDGNGGDAVVCHGYYYLADLLRRARLVKLTREIGGLGRAYGLTPARLLWQFAIMPSVPASLRRLRRALIGRTPALPPATFIAPELAARTDLRERYAAYWHRQPPPRGDRDHHLGNVVDSLPKDGLEQAAAAFAVDQRCPFYDLRVIEYCLAVPSDHKIEGGLTRMLTRRALRRDLPPLVAGRLGKASPAMSLVRGLFGPDRERLEALVFSPETDRFGGCLDLPALRAATRGALGRADPAGTAMPSLRGWHEIDQIRKAAVLVQWLQTARLDD